MQLKVTLNKQRNFTQKELPKLMMAISILQAVVNSPLFKERVLNFKTPFLNDDGVKDYEFVFHETELTNHEVYEKFMSGHQYGDNHPDGELDVDLTVYWSLKSTIGYTYPNTVRTWINRRFFSRFTAAEVCGNVSHEYCHKLGFEHDFYPTVLRDYSVPYGIGYIIRDLAKIYVASGYDMTKLGYIFTGVGICDENGPRILYNQPESMKGVTL